MGVATPRPAEGAQASPRVRGWGSQGEDLRSGGAAPLRNRRWSRTASVVSGALPRVAEGLSLEVVLERLVRTACRLVQAEFGALGAIGDDESLDEFITVGFDAETTKHVGPLPTGHGVLGLRSASHVRCAGTTWVSIPRQRDSRRTIRRWRRLWAFRCALEMLYLGICISLKRLAGVIALRRTRRWWWSAPIPTV